MTLEGAPQLATRSRTAVVPVVADNFAAATRAAAVEAAVDVAAVADAAVVAVAHAMSLHESCSLSFQQYLA